MRRANGGFTLLEVVLALVLLAGMLSMAWGGLQYALRSWDVGADKGRQVADGQLGRNFLRRELSEIFPLRFKDPMTLRFAFEGTRNSLRFASTRPAGLSAAGIALVAIDVERGAVGEPAMNLVMRRALPDEETTSFAPVERADPTIILRGIERVEFSYYGSETEVSEPAWTDQWTFPGRIPQLVRMRITDADGAAQEEIVARVMLVEEAGCLESIFQRICRPRTS